jgi:hypothetical protein
LRIARASPTLRGATLRGTLRAALAAWLWRTALTLAGEQRRSEDRQREENEEEAFHH